VFGESFQRFIIASAAMADHLNSKDELTKMENDFVRSFEEVADVIVNPEFQQFISKKEQ
jgi:hypothetical protein